MSFFLYKIIYIAALTFVFPFELIKRPRGRRLMWLKEKLGGGGGIAPFINGVTDPFINRTTGPFSTEAGAPAVAPVAPVAPPTLWVHAVSVGETAAAVPFIKKLIEMRPGLRVVVSTITDTGRKVAEERLQGLAQVVYLPFDIEFAVRRAIQRVSPALFVVMETELWPVLLKTLHSARVPTVIMNGRVSEGSMRGYMRIRAFMKKALGLVDMFCMQDETYARRIISLGAPPGRVKVTGNFKFDLTPPHGPPQWAQTFKQDGGSVLVAGSTHRGEEKMILSVYKRLLEEFHSLKLILAPRHPERAAEVSGLVQKAGLSYVRRSALEGNDAGDASIIVLDTVGELSSVYGAADVSVVGGSFVPHGGQSPLEPAHWGVPVVCGPHMGNFPFISEFIKEGAALRADKGTLYEVLRGLLKSPADRKASGDKGKEILKRNSGAVERAAVMVTGYLR